MKLKPSSNVFAEAFNTYRVEFIEGARQKVQFFGELESAQKFAKLKNGKVIKPT